MGSVCMYFLPIHKLNHHIANLMGGWAKYNGPCIFYNLEAYTYQFIFMLDCLWERFCSSSWKFQLLLFHCLFSFFGKVQLFHCQSSVQGSVNFYDLIYLTSWRLLLVGLFLFHGPFPTYLLMLKIVCYYAGVTLKEKLPNFFGTLVDVGLHKVTELFCYY